MANEGFSLWGWRALPSLEKNKEEGVPEDRTWWNTWIISILGKIAALEAVSRDRVEKKKEEAVEAEETAEAPEATEAPQETAEAEETKPEPTEETNE